MACNRQTELPANAHADAWPLDGAIAMLNHGSFGACPKAVLERQHELRTRMESEPVRFFVRQAPAMLDESRRALAELIGAAVEDLVFVTNATAAVNSVLRSLKFAPGDELLVTDHDYNACRNVVRHVAERDGARVVVARVPLPIESGGQVVEAVLAGVTPKTRIAVLDHITSPTAVVFPVEELIRRLDERGVDTLVDGAHAAGMIPLRRIGAAYYAGNCHKWLCAPKGCGFLYVRGDHQRQIQPPVISHGFNTPRPGHTRFQDAFDWPGTDDPTAWPCLGEAIRFLSSLEDGGLGRLMERNRRLAIDARRMLCGRLGLKPVCSEQMIGSMAAMSLGEDADPSAALDPIGTTPTHRFNSELLGRFGIEAPVYHWPAPPARLLRISAQAYNSLEQYDRLAGALEVLLAEAG